MTVRRIHVKPCPPHITLQFLFSLSFSLAFRMKDHVLRLFADLHIFAVRPQYHHRGLNSLLIKTGLDVADEARSELYVCFSSMGLPVYLRHEWKKVDEIVMDMSKYGGSGVVVEEHLVRVPGAEP